MGYFTSFEGSFQLDKPLSEKHLKYLKAFSNTRRMKRFVDRLESKPDPLRRAVNLPLGAEGSFFLGDQRRLGTDYSDPSIIDSNHPPVGQPGLWCQWIPNDEGRQISWDGGEKFHNYMEWLQYLIDNFLKPWGYTLFGNVQWQGEDPFDNGVISVKNNVIKGFGPIMIANANGEPRKLKAFLCHSSNDKPTVEAIYNKLVADGVEPWLDKMNLLAGQDWKLEITRAVKNSDVVIVCISHQSISKIGFVQKEIKWALDRADEQPEGSVFIIPVKLEKCKIPERLSKWHCLNWYEENAYDQLLLALRSRTDFLTAQVGYWSD